MKKKILFFILILLLVNPPVLAEQEGNTPSQFMTTEYEPEEVVELIQEEPIPAPQAVSISENTSTQSEKSLRDKLRDVYHLDVDKYNTPNFLLEEVWIQHFDNSIVEQGQFWAAYNGQIGMFFNEGEGENHITNHYDINYINIGYDIDFKDKNADARIMLNYNPFSNRNFAQNLFADMYVGTNKIPHHRLLIGNTRAPVGMEGGYSPFLLPFIARSQIARNFGTVRKLGARAIGNYSLVDYDLGIYSSDTYFQEFFPGTEFVGWINFKPLGKTDGRYGKLKIGTGIDGGNRSNSFFVTGAYVGYEYKRFMANFEWANANGYNGPSGFSSDKHATGFYTTLGYMLNKKLQLLARYDEFDPNKHVANNKKREYSLGLNYFIKGQALKLVFNYIFCQNESAKDSHRLMLGTQILL